MNGGRTPSRTATTCCWSRSAQQCRIDHRQHRRHRAAGRSRGQPVPAARRHQDPRRCLHPQANNPDYEDLAASDEMRTLARLRSVIDPLDLIVGEHFMREEIPALFGETFNPGNWNAGHVVLEAQHAHILFVTLNKQGKAEDHRYLDHWIDEHSFHWQSQNQTTPRANAGGSSSSTTSAASRCTSSCAITNSRPARPPRSNTAVACATRATPAARR